MKYSTHTSRATDAQTRGRQDKVLRGFHEGKKRLREFTAGWVNLTREEQDQRAERTTALRIAARRLVALAGGRGLEAYVAALAETTKGRTPGKALGGNQNRKAVGAKTWACLAALDLLAACDDPVDRRELATEAAAMDLDADPGLGALDAARDVLAAMTEDERTEDEDVALAAIGLLEAHLQQFAWALRGHVPSVLRLAQLGSELEGEHGGDALAGGMLGLREALRRYVPGAKCAASFARNRWIVQGAVRALRSVWGERHGGTVSVSYDYHTEIDGIGRGIAGTLVGDEGAEVLALRLEEELPRERAASALTTIPERLTTRVVNALRCALGVGPAVRPEPARTEVAGFDGRPRVVAPDTFGAMSWPARTTRSAPVVRPAATPEAFASWARVTSEASAALGAPAERVGEDPRLAYEACWAEVSCPA